MDNGFILMYGCIILLMFILYTYVLKMYLDKFNRMQLFWKWAYPLLLLFVPVFGPVPALIMLTVGVGINDK